MTFDEDVYQLMADFPCNNRECATPDFTTDSWVCDPTQAGWCAGTDVRCDPYRELLCNGSEPLYTVIQFNVTLRHEIIPTRSARYYVYRATDPCRYIAIRNYPTWGDPMTNILLLQDLPDYLTKPYVQQRTLREAGFFGPDLASICPGQYDFPFQVGTHVIEVTPFDSLNTATGPPGSNYTLSVGDRAYPPAAPLANNGAGCTVPAEASTWRQPDGSAITATWQCIDDSIPVVWNSSVSSATRYLVYTVPLNVCQTVYWVQSAGSAYLGYAFGNDVRVPYESTDYGPTDWNLVAFGGNPGGNFLQLCSNSTHNYHLLAKVPSAAPALFRSPAVNFNMFYVDSTPGYRWLERIADKEPYVATWDLQFSSQLRCINSQTGQLTKRACNFRLPMDNDNSECYRYWQYYPSERPNPIFPLPAWLFGDSRFVNYYPDIMPLPSNGRQYFSASLIEFQPDISQSPQTVFGNSPTSLALDSCRMQFMGSIVDSQGNPVSLTPVPFTPRELDCTWEGYNQVLPVVEQVAVRLTQVVTPDDVRNARVAMDILTYSSNYSDCTNFLARELVETTPVSRTISSTICDPDRLNTSDPCCNPDLSWNGTGCEARRLTYSVNKFNRLSSTGNAVCRISDSSNCASLFASDYVASSENARSSLEGCGVNTPVNVAFQGIMQRSLRNVTDYWMGTDPAGVAHRCQVDADCTLLDGDGGPYSCDLLRGTCKYPIDKLYQHFLADWLPSVPFVIKTVMITQLGISVNDTNDPAAWYDALTADHSDCTGEYTWGYGYRTSYGRYWTVQANALGCMIGDSTAGEDYCPQRFCMHSFCTVEFACQANTGSNGLCWTGFSSLPFIPANCTRGQIQRGMCNWADGYATPNYTNPGSPIMSDPAGCTTDANVCAVCETGSEVTCLGFPDITVEATCTSSFACFLANGSRVITSTAAECNALMSCNSTCYGPDGKTLVPCASQAECEGSGQCDTIGWSFKNLGDGNTYRPACVVPPLVWWGSVGDCAGIPGDGGETEYGRPTPYGCMYYEQATDTDCSVYGSNAFHWNPLNNQSSCTAKTGCWQVYDTSLLQNDHTWSQKSQSDCAAAGGQTLSLSKWHPGIWRGGVARPLTWLATSNQTVPYPVRPTMDLMKFGRSFTYAVDLAYALPQLSETYCRYNSLRSSLTPVLCACTPDGAKNSSCFNSDSTFGGDTVMSASAILTVCEGTGFQTDTVTPFTITFDQRTVNYCRTAYVDIYPASHYAQNSAAALSTFLLDFSVSRPYQFTNHRGALVGQIIGDGIVLNSDFVMVNVTLCANPRPDITVTNKGYTEYDFARAVVGDESDRPELLFVSNAYWNPDLGAVCATIKEMDSKHAYYPVRRYENAATRRKSDFGGGQTAFYAIMCTCYLVVACLAASRFIATIFAGTFAPRNTQVWIYLTIFLLTIIRALYVILILTGVVIGNNSTAIDYILVELPSFLFLTIMTFFIIIWATLIRVNRKLSRRKNNTHFWGIFFFINGIIYGIFIILIIIYESVKPQSRTSCGGRLVTIDQTTRRNTAIAYRAILAGFALIISIAFFVTGSRIYMSLQGASNVRADRKRKIFWLTTVCSIGLLGVSTLLIVLAGSGKQNNYVALSLLVVFEVIPCTAIVIVLWKVDTKEKMSDTGKTTRSNSKGNSVQMRSMVTSEHTSTGRSSTRGDTDDDTDGSIPGSPTAAGNATDEEEGIGARNGSSAALVPAAAAAAAETPSPERRRKKKLANGDSPATRSPESSAPTSPATSPKPKKRRAAGEEGSAGTPVSSRRAAAADGSANGTPVSARRKKKAAGTSDDPSTPILKDGE